MVRRCRVTFFDLTHRIGRTVEVGATTPLIAAEEALKKMLDRDMFVSDFGDTVRVETITTIEQSLPLATVAERIKPSCRVG
jgi:hypothetical protein